MARANPQRRRPRLADRLELLLSTSRRIDGLWIGGLEDQCVLTRVEEALGVIKAHDRLRYDRLIRDLERIWVRILPGSNASFNYSINACQLDSRFVSAETSSLDRIATVIVHEATHARLWHCGIGYEEEQRSRVEAVCLRRELAFAAKLPNGNLLREGIEYTLANIPDDYLTNAAFRTRNEQGIIEALRHFGFSEFSIRTILAYRSLARAVIRFVRHLRRFLGV